MISSAPLHNVTRYSNEYVCFRSHKGDGLVHRLGPTNRVFYTQSFDAAERAAAIAASRGISALRQVASEEAELGAVLSTMDSVGLFAEMPGRAVDAIAWRISDQASAESQLCACVRASSLGFGRGSYRWHVCASLAESIVPFCKQVDKAIADIAKRVGGQQGIQNAQSTNPVFAFTSLRGEEACVPELVRYLDQKRIQLVYETSVAEPAGGNVVLRRLESEGFLPSHRITVGAEEICDARGRSNALSKISCSLAEEPTREVAVRFVQPGTFGSVSDVDMHFDRVEEVIGASLGIEEDLSRLSYIQRAFSCLMCSRTAEAILEAIAANEVITVHNYPDGDLVESLPSSAERLLRFYEASITTLLRSDEDQVGRCRGCSYQQVCPVNLLIRLRGCPEKLTNVQQRVEARRCLIWRKMFDWTVEQLLEVCRENVASAVPLRMDIAGSEVTFSAIDASRA